MGWSLKLCSSHLDLWNKHKYLHTYTLMRTVDMVDNHTRLPLTCRTDTLGLEITNIEVCNVQWLTQYYYQHVLVHWPTDLEIPPGQSLWGHQVTEPCPACMSYPFNKGRKPCDVVCLPDHKPADGNLESMKLFTWGIWPTIVSNLSHVVRQVGWDISVVSNVIATCK